MPTETIEIKKDSVTETINGAYNLAIDHAIHVVKSAFTFSGKLSPNTTEEKIISNLKDLKS